MKPAILLQHLLPAKLLSRVVYAATRWRFKPWKNFLIRTIIRLYDVDFAEAASTNLDDYPHFNAWFTRALKPGARPPHPSPRAILMPADGRISELGRIEAGRIVQAKQHGFTVAELLADEAAAGQYAGGSFITVYLAPRDYHRIHMPCAGTLLETVHVPGRLFSVAPFTVADIPGLFARNERLACHFDTTLGPMAVVLVGAMLVSGVETVFGGVEIPPYARDIRRREYRDAQPRIALERNAELGRFNMGSTVVVLLPPGIELDPHLSAGDAVRVGQRLAAPSVR
ncbi:MAG TPA: archaetidylserine decarboxylase [Candidatus Saccharimonadia bacterium]|nr:archaetidylserine decarboxylase [Candidatus Saccharimonadia bacterium]